MPKLLPLVAIVLFPLTLLAADPPKQSDAPRQLKLGVGGTAIAAPAPPAAPATDAHAGGMSIGEAVCVFTPTKGSNVKGSVTLKQESGYVQVTGEVSGLSPGEHGFHVHMFGDTRAENGDSAGGHYNPDGHQHGSLDSNDRHAGDLGNIKADDKGVAKVDVKAKGLNLHMVFGRSLVVHEKADDFKTQPTGASGARVAVGVIGLAEVKQPAK